MGFIYDTISALFVAGLVALVYVQYTNSRRLQPPKSKAPPRASRAASGKKGKKRKQNEAALSDEAQTSPPEVKVVPFPPVIPGDLTSEPTFKPAGEEPAPKVKKAKKKKAKRAQVASSAGDESDLSPGPSSTPRKAAKPTSPTSVSADTDGSWMRVTPNKRKLLRPEDAAGVAGEQHSAENTASDVGATSERSTPVAERTEDEALSRSESTENRKTLAEKLLPKPRKTGIEDMTETPDHPTLARVMRVQPRPDEKPAAGFSWADYEDVQVDNDADGEEDGGWGVVKSRGRPKINRTESQQSQSHALKAPETITKKQRQNAAKRAAEKEAKKEAEAERQALLAKHKRELEKNRIAEQFAASGKGGKKTSGGMTATVDEKGKLVWE